MVGIKNGDFGRPMGGDELRQQPPTPALHSPSTWSPSSSIHPSIHLSIHRFIDPSIGATKSYVTGNALLSFRLLAKWMSVDKRALRRPVLRFRRVETPKVKPESNRNHRNPQNKFALNSNTI